MNKNMINEANKAIKELEEFIKCIKNDMRPEPKYKVGDEVLYDGDAAKIIKYDKTDPNLSYEIIFPNLNKRWVKESLLSMVPEMYVGKRWTIDANPIFKWNGYEVECVRKDTKFGAYEQVMFADTTHDNSWYPEGSDSLCEQHWIIRCIDPQFWTGEIEGEKVRCYEYQDSRIFVCMYNSNNNFIMDKVPTSMYEKLFLAAIKSANIPIMPYEQSNGNYLPPEK